MPALRRHLNSSGVSSLANSLFGRFVGNLPSMSRTPRASERVQSLRRHRQEISERFKNSQHSSTSRVPEWGRPLLSRPRGAVDSGPAAVLAAMLSRSRFRPRRAVVRVCRWVWVDGCEVRPCDPCARVRPCVPCVPCVSRLPRCLFTGTLIQYTSRVQCRGLGVLLNSLPWRWEKI